MRQRHGTSPGKRQRDGRCGKMPGVKEIRTDTAWRTATDPSYTHIQYQVTIRRTRRILRGPGGCPSPGHSSFGADRDLSWERQCAMYGFWCARTDEPTIIKLLALKSEYTLHSTGLGTMNHARGLSSGGCSIVSFLLLLLLVHSHISSSRR